jgi:predicted nucleic acid-binding protein
MKLVLDSSIAVKFVLPESDSDKARLLRDDIRAKVHEVIAPDVFHVELGHALTRAERQARIAHGAGYSLWLQVMKESPHLFPSLPLMPVRSICYRSSASEFTTVCILP